MWRLAQPGQQGQWVGKEGDVEEAGAARDMTDEHGRRVDGSGRKARRPERQGTCMINRVGGVMWVGRDGDAEAGRRRKGQEWSAGSAGLSVWDGWR